MSERATRSILGCAVGALGWARFGRARRTCVVAVLALALAGATDPAAAAVVEAGPTGGGVRYRADAGEANVVSIAVSGREVRFSDAGATIRLAMGAETTCSTTADGDVACLIPPMGLQSVNVLLGDGNDEAQTIDPVGNLVVVWLYGEDGADQLIGGDDRDLLDGGDGPDSVSGRGRNDSLDGGAGDDILRSGPGDDELTGSAGNDDLGGGTGQDSVWYRRRGRVRITLDGRPNDGMRGERDWIRRDVENASGSGTLIGNSRSNYLYGSGHIRGGGGNDSLSGDGRLVGGSGADSIDAAGGQAFGGAGNDRLFKAEGTQSGVKFFGGLGNDTISGVDISCPADACFEEAVEDLLACGPGRDKATLGTDDIARRDCEMADRSKP